MSPSMLSALLSLRYPAVWPLAGYGDAGAGTNETASAVRVIDKINTFPHFGRKLPICARLTRLCSKSCCLKALNAGALVIRNRRYTGDGGIDGRVKIDGQTAYRAKRYTSYIAVGHVRDFSDLLNATGARGFSAIPAKRARRKSLIRGDSRMIWSVASEPYCHRCAVYPYPGYRPPTNGSS